VVTQHDGSVRDNPKWCQNPQYHIKVNDLETLDDLHLKIILRRKDKIQTAPAHSTTIHVPSHGSRTTNASTPHVETKEAPNIGFVVCKAETNEDPTKKNLRKKAIRTNALGEAMQKKETTLKKNRNVRVSSDGQGEIQREAPTSSIPPPVIQRRLYVDDKTYNVQTTYSSKTDSCVYFPCLPRVWIPNGLILVPSLQEYGVKGTFDIEIYSSDAVTVTPLPASVLHSVSGEWVEGTNGGSHINPNWKKNPKYILSLPNSGATAALSLPTPFQIKLSRNGTSWKRLTQTDAVGCMIGFYIFVQTSSGELIPYFETTFVPSIEVTTEPDFSLQPLQDNEAYVIMPTTYLEGKNGPFVLSFTADCEFSVAKEKNIHK
jgi:hypothetical protein